MGNTRSDYFECCWNIHSDRKTSKRSPLSLLSSGNVDLNCSNVAIGQSYQSLVAFSDRKPGPLFLETL